MFYKKEDLMRIGLDVGVIIGSGVLFKHCIKVNNNWIEQCQFREVKTSNGESVYEKIQGSGKIVDKHTMKQISSFTQIANLVGSMVALYGIIFGSTMLTSDLYVIKECRKNDKIWDNYYNKYIELVENKNLNETQKKEVVSSLRAQYGYIDIFEEEKTAEFGRKLNTNKTQKTEIINKSQNIIKEQSTESKSNFPYSSVKETPKQYIDTALENKKPAVYDEA